jgi:hypothetical protein
MLGWSWHVLPAVRSGNWRSNLIGIAQLSVGLVAFVALASMVTLNPFWLLAFTVVQGLLVLGLILYVVVVIFNQRALVEEDFDAGETIFRQGEFGRDLYVIKTGRVHILMTDETGAERLIKELGPGDHFGEMALIDGGARSADIVAESELRCFCMTAWNFRPFVRAHPDLAWALLETLVARLREAQSPAAAPAA